MGGACTLKGLQIKNVRSLKDTAMLSLSPITVLVGENSSGKSTFLRTFPLLKQSITKRTSGPLLWAGDYDDYVDFGSFKATVTNDGSDAIMFGFSFDFDESDAYHYSFPYLIFESQSITKVVYEIKVVSNEGRDVVAELIFQYGNNRFIFDFTRNEILVNEEKIKSISHSSAEVNKDFVRNPFFSTRRDSPSSIFEFTLPSVSQVREKLYGLIGLETKKSGPKRERDSSLQYVIDYIGAEFLHGADIPEIRQKISKKIQQRKNSFHPLVDPNLLIDAISRVEKLEWAEKNKLISMTMLCAIYTIYPCVEAYIRTYFRNVHYIAPLRATAERYYRLRNLAVDEIDYQGKNLAVFLNSLTTKKLQNFQQWTMEHFGFSVVKSTSEGHLSLGILLKDSKKSVNLSDTGFGYSQILPIITQLWELASRKTENIGIDTPLVVAIEQPELHLHPAMQAKLARAFIATLALAEEHGYQMQLILETHSETIVNYFGRAIAKGMLMADDVSVVLFEKNAGTNLTTVKTSTYDDEGYLQNWPYGFFNPGE